MGDEISRLASYEAECYRKDGVIVSLRNEIADLKSVLNEKDDTLLRYCHIVNKLLLRVASSLWQTRLNYSKYPLNAGVICKLALEKQEVPPLA